MNYNMYAHNKTTRSSKQQGRAILEMSTTFTQTVGYQIQAYIPYNDLENMLIFEKQSPMKPKILLLRSCWEDRSGMGLIEDLRNLRPAEYQKSVR